MDWAFLNQHVDLLSFLCHVPLPIQFEFNDGEGCELFLHLIQINIAYKE